MAKTRRWLPLACGLLLGTPLGVQAQVWPGKTDPDGYTFDSIKASFPEYFARTGGRGGTTPEDLPDVFGPGAVLGVGNIQMKVTNFGHLGNFFTNLSGDPAGQWPGASGIEYLSTIRLAVGAVNTAATDPAGKRRVSYLFEWRPETLDPVDKIYKAYDGIVKGSRFVNDDDDERNDPGSGLPVKKIDEDFLDGHDNDGDRKVDEDFAALGQQMYSFVMWDNTIQAINTTFNEKHIPLGLEVRQKVWAYSIRGLQDFNVSAYEIFNRSGGDLDSVTVGFLVDMDAGPAILSNFFQDDFDVPQFPSGEFTLTVDAAPPEGLPDELRKQTTHDRNVPDRAANAPLCPTFPLRINGFSIADDDGDTERTIGIPSFLLIEHSTDPLGRNGPKKVGFRAFRSFTAGTPYTGGGNPTIDQQRFEFMTGSDNIDPETGFVRLDMPPGDTKGDYVEWVAVGSALGANGPGESNGMWKLGNGQSIHVTIAFAVQEGRYEGNNSVTNYVSDYERYKLGTLRLGDLFGKYPALVNAVGAQITYEGVHTLSANGLLTPGVSGLELYTPGAASANSLPFHGRETAVRQAVGSGDTLYFEDCPERDPRQVFVNNREWSWFDFDCDYCSGPWSYPDGRSVATDGLLFHKTWNAEAPPPNPNLNVATNYNYSDNPNRRFAPSGDREITLAWDNLSEVTADPKSNCFDFRGYRVWKVSDWTRPVGSAGPGEADWKLIGEYRLFDYDRGVPIQRNYTVDPVTGAKSCPLVFIPNYVYQDSLTGQTRVGREIPICLDRGDLWDKQTGKIIKPDPTVPCIYDDREPDSCSASRAGIVHRQSPAPEPCKAEENKERRRAYQVGRYRYVDKEVKNGFVYFYSVTAIDSTSETLPDGRTRTNIQEGRRSAVEAEAVTPQTNVQPGRHVWVVPNPYRGFAQIRERPSTWDLTPNASDPTGTHIDFMGLPPGTWTIKIFTVAGDLVATITSSDPVNESVRAAQTIPGTARTVPGYNRQKDYEGDGQARWNLISRNGQDVVSGIYMFTVESGQGTQRGRFVIIR